MGINYDEVTKYGGIPKGTPRVVTKRKKRLDDKKAEKECRDAVRQRYGGKCVVPGCRERGTHLHHVVYRSRSRALRWHPDNLVPLCVGHHQLEHAGKITIRRDDAGELIIDGPADLLKFTL